MILLLSCWIISGIMANDPSMTYYQLKNSSVCLDVTRPPPYKRGHWEFDGNGITFDTTITPKYTDKVDFFPGNLSLCIKELTDTDNGTYKVSFMDSSYHWKTEMHTVIVEELVPTPVIMISVLHSNLSAGSCNISVNCSIKEDWLWSVCGEDSCRTSQKSLNKVNITISSDNTTVVCSGSNHVSENNVSESKDTTCFTKSSIRHIAATSTPLVVAILVALGVFAFTCIIFLAKKWFSAKYDQGQTAHLIRNLQVEAPSHPELRVSTTSSTQTEAAYENVDAIDPNQTSRIREELGSMSHQKADTIYSTIQAPKVTLSPGKNDSSKNAKGHQNRQEPSISQSVPLGEAEQPMQIDTVYSLLQKPKNLKPQH